MNKLNLKTTLLVVILSLFNTTASSAQNTPENTTTVSGRVIDKRSTSPITGATIIIKGTTNGAISNLEGEFKISVPKDAKSIVLVTTFMGYEKSEVSYIVKERNGRLKKDIILATDNLVLDEIKVVGSAATAIIKGDTTQFNSGAFKTNPDATAEDLIAKMPGFEVEDGKVTAQGESISRVYVDGKSFFKNDPMAALNALPADAIESIQLFDEKSEKSSFTGTDDGKRISTINIVTKAKSKNMKMGDFIAGYGSNNRYSTKANVNIFEGDNRFSIGFGANNINQSTLSGSKFYGRHGITGIEESLGLKLNYSGEFKGENDDITELGTSYIFNKKSSDVLSEKLQQSLFNDEIYNITSSNYSNSDSHSFSLDLKSNFGTNMIVFEPFASINNSSSNITNSTERNNGSFITNKSNTDTKNSADSYNVGGTLEWMKHIGDKSSIAIGSTVRFSESDSDQILIGNSAQYSPDLDDLVDSLINQNREIYTGNNTTTGYLNYNYKIDQEKSIGLEYEVSYDWSDSDNMVYLFDPITEQYTDIYENLSNVFNRDYLTNIGGIRYSAFAKDKYKFNMGVNYQHAALQNNLTFPEGKSYDYSFNSVKIDAGYDYYFNKSSRVSLSYKGQPSLPSLGQLQDVVDNSNPLMVSKGNPYLEQSFSNSLTAKYYSTNVEKSTNFGYYASIRQELNSFANSITKIQSDTLVNGVPVQAGSQLSSTVNLDNKLSIFNVINYSFPLNFISSKMNVGAMYRFSRTPSIYNGVTQHTDNNYFNTRFSIHSNISENIDFSISNMLSYTAANNSSSINSTSKYLTEKVTASFNWIFLKNFVFNTNYSLNYNHYFDNGTSTQPSNDTFHLLNAGLGYKFMDKNAEVRISGFDLLNQSQSIMRSVGEQFVTDNITNVLQRHFMVTLSFKFNSMKNAPATSGNGDFGPSHGRGPGGGGGGGIHKTF